MLMSEYITRLIKELEIDNSRIDGKPWVKDGMNIGEWFNFGFNETQWKLFVNKQILMHYEKNKIERDLDRWRRRLRK